MNRFVRREQRTIFSFLLFAFELQARFHNVTTNPETRGGPFSRSPPLMLALCHGAPLKELCGATARPAAANLPMSYPFLPFLLSLSLSGVISVKVHPGSCHSDVSLRCDASHAGRTKRQARFKHAASARLGQPPKHTQTHTNRWFDHLLDTRSPPQEEVDISSACPLPTVGATQGRPRRHRHRSDHLLMKCSSPVKDNTSCQLCILFEAVLK